MADIDASMLDFELTIWFFLAGQIVLGLACIVFGYLSRPTSAKAWLRGGFFIFFVLSLILGGLSVYKCFEASVYAQGRLDGRIAGAFLPEEKGRNHLAAIRIHGWMAGCLLIATLFGSVFCFRRKQT
jgi:hypothetical protein